MLRYVVVGALEEGEWIFVRHRDRSTWELPAGHLEEGESPEEAARRELWEESGARGSLECLADYRVDEEGRSGFGRLFLARVQERGELPGFETDAVLISSSLPENLTYGNIQRPLFHRLEMSLRS